MQRLTRSHPVFGVAIMIAAFATVAAADVAKATATHIYVDQAAGSNSGTTAGTTSVSSRLKTRAPVFRRI